MSQESVFVVVLEHEHGTDVGVRRRQEDARQLLIDYMLDTVGDVESYAAEDSAVDQQDFQVRLGEFRTACEEGNADAACQIYNDLFEEIMPLSEMHRAWYRKCTLE